MKKLYFPILSIIIALFIIGCEKDESDSPSSNGGSSQPKNLSFEPSGNPILTSVQNHEIKIMGGTPPYRISSGDTIDNTINGDTLNIYVRNSPAPYPETPSQLSLTIEDSLGRNGTFTYVACPENLYLEAAPFSGNAQMGQDTTTLKIQAGNYGYNPDLDQLSFRSDTSKQGNDNELEFKLSGLKNGNPSVNLATLIVKDSVNSTSLFNGLYELDMSENQIYNIEYDSLGIPSNYTFDFNLVEFGSSTKKLQISTSSKIDLSTFEL